MNLDAKLYPTVARYVNHTAQGKNQKYGKKPQIHNAYCIIFLTGT